MMYLALTYDHRLLDGKDAVLFLKRIQNLVENPKRMLFEI
jgi:2-oxoglutarate dehydrogenase E2 component (dihydrolipoamide succinyltransferase)